MRQQVASKITDSLTLPSLKLSDFGYSTPTTQQMHRVSVTATS
jgi:hypothetical protein